MHFLVAYQATTWAISVYTLKRDRNLGISRSKRMQLYPGGGVFALFFRPHPREFAIKTKKKMPIPGG